ncbi:Glutamate--cysteine ligase GshA [Methyloligella halotolerans]|uniref:Glutamate--cysteine ligase n=1 Tax=Methyloligella halotolerans TaxID=1177755 RepID=A0A1E2RYA7_9HYPH|nr:glutamate--cysteine ligase [Methyloligella halotolerans]ODA67226.1 Glutamate--cysteine ligase GshA [Methyloligella halotolerans]
MSTRVDGPASPTIESRDELVADLEKGCKPPETWRIGTEHEKFAFYQKDHTPVPYEGDRGIGALLAGLRERFGWDPIYENGNLIALNRADCDKGGSVTLEPGGQLELSGATLETVHQTCEEVRQHLVETEEIGDELGIGFLGLGFSPKWTLRQTPMMPKARYRIMADYMPKVGTLGRDMMFRTATVQVNLDFADEADMLAKLRVGLALQPVATALFANSPFTEGHPNGFKSYRAEIWRDTDPERTGGLPQAFDDDFGFERYVDYALNVPMYFVYRDGRYIDVAGASFKDFLDGKLTALPGERPTMADWSDHLTTAFPDVRLKHFLEMRGADAGPVRNICALSAFWVGLIYDAQSLSDAAALIADWTAEERLALRNSVPARALDAPFRGGTVADVAEDVLRISEAGLERRARLDAKGRDERHFLKPLHDSLEHGVPADRLLAAYEGPWQSDIDRIFTEEAYRIKPFALAV